MYKKPQHLNYELPLILWTSSVDKFSALYLLKKGDYYEEKTDTSPRLRVTFERNNVITPLTLLANPTATQVRVSVPASLLTELGTATIRLQNTDASATETMPPDGPSATTTITVVPPRPTLTSVSPNTATAGTGAQPVTITGAKFIQQALRIVIRNAQSGLSRDLNAVTFSSNTSVGGFFRQVCSVGFLFRSCCGYVFCSL